MNNMQRIRLGLLCAKLKHLEIGAFLRPKFKEVVQIESVLRVEALGPHDRDP